MKRTVLTFGVISGAVSSLMMLATLPFVDEIGFDRGAIVGYTAIVLSFLLVFFGIRSYRDNVGGGAISLGRGLAIGLLITLISSAFYVATWEVIYFKFMPDFADKFTAYTIAQARAKGATPEAIAAKEREGREFKTMYDNPLNNIALTFTEPLPVGLLVTVVSAAVLRKKPARGVSAPRTS